MKIAFFDSKPYTKKFFTDLNQSRHFLQFLEPKLNHETVKLAEGFDGICAFVNDRLDEPIIKTLSSLGVSLIALRCKGSNNLDIQACKAHKVEAVMVSGYSPYSVAEHAVALILTINRHIHKAYNRIREAIFHSMV
jgi:D-lactate dehydrogenase